MNCKECCNYVDTYEQFLKCRLTNICLNKNGTAAEKCDYFNKDLAKEKICLNCTQFLGGGDWGLACEKHYYRLPEALTAACEDVIYKKEKMNNDSKI